ncbi:MAG: type III pantothenate kinase [Planctomycetota bacterium]|nr:type III pantothenate kinase [Planctomycetota bacterium]
MQILGGPNVDLLCDLGNSYLKVALVKGLPSKGRPEAFEPLMEIEHGDSGRVETWSRIFAALDGRKLKPSRILVASVAGAETREGLLRAFDRPGLPPVICNPDSGLELRIRHPETVGMDRLYAALGAFWRVGCKPAIVVDAGTAMTVDVVVPGEQPGVGAFLGGAIAPGPTMLAEALGAGGAQLNTIRPKPGARALGRETAEALEAGVVVGFQGAALHLVRRVTEEAGLDSPPVVLMGGASDFLGPLFKEQGLPLHYEPGLVQAGLWLATGDPTA